MIIVDNDNSSGNRKTLKLSIGAIKKALKWFFPDCYENQKKCDKAVNNYFNAFVPDCFKTQKMCDTAVDICPSAMQFVPE